MSQNRRTFLKQSAALSALALSPNFLANSIPQSKAPHRFIFVRKSSGLIPSYCVPVSFSEKQKTDEKLPQNKKIC